MDVRLPLSLPRGRGGLPGDPGGLAPPAGTRAGLAPLLSEPPVKVEAIEDEGPVGGPPGALGGQ